MVWVGIEAVQVEQERLVRVGDRRWIVSDVHLHAGPVLMTELGALMG